MDVACLQALLGQLVPNKDQLNKAKTRIKWLQDTERLTPVIERLLGTLDDENKGFRSQACNAVVQNCKLVPTETQLSISIFSRLLMCHILTIAYIFLALLRRKSPFYLGLTLSDRVNGTSHAPVVRPSSMIC